MATRIVDYGLDDDTHQVYDVFLDEDGIRTTVTHTPSCVDVWINDILFTHRHRLHKLIVGLDVEWRPNFIRGGGRNPVATLQLCVGRKCLIFQLLYCSCIPQSLVDFLTDSGFTFVGVGIGSDIEKLCVDHDLAVANAVDLGRLAMERVEGVRRNVGLRELASRVLEIRIEKPRNITLSRWDDAYLSNAQIKYACVDAFASFEIGRILDASTYN